MGQVENERWCGNCVVLWGQDLWEVTLECIHDKVIVSLWYTLTLGRLEEGRTDA